jgi:hypothetical protein
MYKSTVAKVATKSTDWSVMGNPLTRRTKERRARRTAAGKTSRAEGARTRREVQKALNKGRQPRRWIPIKGNVKPQEENASSRREPKAPRPPKAGRGKVGKGNT